MSNVWKISPGKKAENWNVFLERECIGLGWAKLEDYQTYRSEQEVLQALEARYGKNERGRGKGAAKIIWRFVHEVRHSHVIVANDGYKKIVGIGVVRSDYLPPNSPENPMKGDTTTHRHHARRVQWLITSPVVLPDDHFFIQATLGPLDSSKADRIRRAYLKDYPNDPELKEALERLFGLSTGSESNNAVVDEAMARAERQLTQEKAFDPTGIEDARERVISSIVRRRGQSSFRSLLLSAYQQRCAITGCAVEAVLEAAHIIPYQGKETHHVANGLLLRSDWHILFDVHLVTVDHTTMRLVISPELKGTEYRDFHGKQIRLPVDPACRPNRDAIKQHQQQSGLIAE